ncbi:MAG TPA: PQQ-binding-like beta-propeller repeat protein [Vicinamibacterales bacterium]|nr:PQQ-binding-like beta-propeller repeat protein [Vicinamibacterales bacterium]
MTSREYGYYKRVLRATTTICCGLAIGAGLLLPQTPPAPPAPGQAVPARKAPAPTWQLELPTGGDVALAIGDDAVFLGDTAGTIRAFVLTDGSLRWEVPTAPGIRLAAGRDAVFVVAAGTLASRAAADGRVQWTQPMPDGPVTLAWHLDRVAVTSGAHARLYDGHGQVEATLAFPGELAFAPVLDADRVAGAIVGGGLAVFERPSPTTPAWTSAPLPGPIDALTLDGDRLLASAADGSLSAFAIGRHGHHARPEWRYELYRQASGAPAVDGRAVFVATLDNTLHAIDRLSGSRRWHRPLGGRPIGAVLSSGERVVVLVADGSVAVINARTGAGIARLAMEGQTEQLLAAGLVSGEAPAVVTVTANTSGLNVLRLWRLDP